jgi:hypothetical protein
LQLFLQAFLFTLIHSSVWGQSAQQFFGKNRVQTRKFDWQYLSTKNFDVYFYEDGDSLARITAESAEGMFGTITDMIGYLPYNKTRIFVYKTDADRLQSNVGLADVDYVVGGKTTFIKAQVEVAFNGSHVAYKRELTYELSRLFIYDMMYGGTLRDMIQSTYLLNLPDWFVEGAARYVAYGWDIEMDNYMRDIVTHRRFKKPTNTQGTDAQFYGQSIWNYIAERYGKSNVSNILNLTRIIRNEEVSISSTLAISFDFFLKEWQYYYKSMALPELEELPKRRKVVRASQDDRLYNLRFSPDGKRLLYIQNSEGRSKIVSYSIKRRSKNVVLRTGTRLVTQRPDFTAPVAAWKSNSEIAVVIHKGNQLQLTERTLGSLQSRKRFLGNLNQIQSLDYNDDGSVAVMSGERNGQSDLFIYNDRRGTIFQLTNDIFDDLEPRFVAGSRNAFTFVSNRTTDSTLSQKGNTRDIKDDYDLYLYEPDSSRSRFYRITRSAGNEHLAFATSLTDFYFLSEENGILSMAFYQRGAPQLTGRTNYDLNMYDFDYSPVQNLLAFTTHSGGRRRLVLLNEHEVPTQISDLKTKRQDIKDQSAGIQSGKKSLLANLADRKQKIPATVPAKADPLEIDIYNYVFETEKLDKPMVIKSDLRQEMPVSQGRRFSRFGADAFKLTEPRIAEGKVGADNLTTTAQIHPLMGFGLLVNMGMSDMLGNHRFHGGLFGATNFRSSIMYVEYEYLARRVDFRARYEKKSLFLANEPVIHRYNLNRFELTASYPFSAASRISFSPFFTVTRFTNVFFTGFGVRDALRHYSGYKLEYIYDKTIVNGLNMFEGTRAKIKLEEHYGFRADGIDFGTINADVRRYQRIHNEIILAGRAAYGQFFGEARKDYLLGGVDNWFFNNFEPGGIITPERRNPDQQDRSDLLFTEFATNMRGFNYNKLRGNHYLLFNIELRMPIVRYLYKGPISSGFFKNLQFVAFTDIGTAWSGISPFSQLNSINNRVVQDGAFTANVRNFRNPFLRGQGVGVRTLVFGYYLKFDVAWGVEDFNINRPGAYLSLGYDF